MRDQPTIEPRFGDTYHYADVITDIVENQIDHLQLWDEFVCDDAVGGLVAPYLPRSAFHAFISHVVDSLLYDYTVDVDLDQRKSIAKSFRRMPEAIADLEPFTLPVEQALRRRRFKFESFLDWLDDQGKQFSETDQDDLAAYLQDLRLSGPYEDLVLQSTREVFFTLFANRTLLLRFNEIIAEEVSDLSLDGLDSRFFDPVEHYFESRGVLRRAYMPEWVRRAVYFRDRGRCVACKCDLTGIVSVQSEENFDHMVPLASGGLNDVSNIQLLCGRCNRRKADGAPFTLGTYEDWYLIADVLSPPLAMPAKDAPGGAARRGGAGPPSGKSRKSRPKRGQKN